MHRYYRIAPERGRLSLLPNGRDGWIWTTDLNLIRIAPLTNCATSRNGGRYRGRTCLEWLMAPDVRLALTKSLWYQTSHLPSRLANLPCWLMLSCPARDSFTVSLKIAEKYWPSAPTLHIYYNINFILCQIFIGVASKN